MLRSLVGVLHHLSNLVHILGHVYGVLEIDFFLWRVIFCGALHVVHSNGAWSEGRLVSRSYSSGVGSRVVGFGGIDALEGCRVSRERIFFVE